VTLFERIAEQKIREAVERGELDNLPGAGRPLDLGEDPLVPEEVRLAYRLLKNAGFLPPALETRREIRELQRVLERLGEGTERSRALRKLQALDLALAEARGRGVDLRRERRYHPKLIDKLS